MLLTDKYVVHEDKGVSEVKAILWSLSKVTQNENGSQVSDTGPMVLWSLFWKEVFIMQGHKIVAS